MANCSICGKKMGIFEENVLSNTDQNLSSYYMCGKCDYKIRKFKEGDISFFNELQHFQQQASDENIKLYIGNILQPEDIKVRERIEKQLEKERKEKELIQKKEQFQQKIAENANFIMLTTGFNFEGYMITKYQEVISGECVLGTGFLSEFNASIADLTGTSSNLFSQKLREAKQQAINQLEFACYMTDCNAIIGVDFDYISFSSNMIGVVANGTAVKIEKMKH